MLEPRTIEINEDIMCPRCGKPGATIWDGEPGLCLECGAKAASFKVGPNVIAKMLAMTHDLFVSYQGEMDKAYKLLEEDPLAISIGFKLKPGNNGINIETTISFTKKKIKDKTHGFASEIQQELFKE